MGKRKGSTLFVLDVLDALPSHHPARVDAVLVRLLGLDKAVGGDHNGTLEGRGGEAWSSWLLCLDSVLFLSTRKGPYWQHTEYPTCTPQTLQFISRKCTQASTKSIKMSDSRATRWRGTLS